MSDESALLTSEAYMSHPCVALIARTLEAVGLSLPAFELTKRDLGSGVLVAEDLWSACDECILVVQADIHSDPEKSNFGVMVVPALEGDWAVDSGIGISFGCTVDGWGYVYDPEAFHPDLIQGVLDDIREVVHPDSPQDEALAVVSLALLLSHFRIISEGQE